MDAAAGTATATASAIPAAVITANGTKVASRTGWGGYTRISGSTVSWMEVGDTMPGQPIYDSVVPFFSPSSTSLTDITIVGGRTFDMTYTVPASLGIADLTGGTVHAQVRESANGRLLATFWCQVIAADQVRFLLSPTHTQAACPPGLKHAVWDAEVLLDSVEYTLIPTSAVTLVPGVTHVNGSYPEDSARSDGRAYDAMVVVS